MEFISDTEGGEYSSKPTYPPGKWFYYEQILQVPNYVIFEPEGGVLEVYRRDDLARSAEAPHSLLGVWDECAGVGRDGN